MAVVTGALDVLLPKLGNLPMGEYHLQTSVRDDITFLKAELESMEAALFKISEAPIDEPPDIQDMLWAKEVRDLSYDVEDCVDKFMVHVGREPTKDLHGLRGFIDRCLNLVTMVKNHHSIGRDIRGIKRRIEEVSERRVRHKVDNNVAAKLIGPSVDNLRLSALYKNATELVGTKESSDELIKRLMDGYEDPEQHGLKIISIVGFGGLGKTTLAKTVYDKLKQGFVCFAFVPISNNPNMEKIFKAMLRQLHKDKYKNIMEELWDEAQLIEELKNLLHDKRYLIVIDDIWQISVWETIQFALIRNTCGSRVITTTRILDVAQKIGGVYQLQPLTLPNSRKLFYLRIFGSEENCLPNELAEVSEKILKKCGGAPLAIITIASMLASTNRKENLHKFWSRVYQSMGSGLEDGPDTKKMRRILSVSYYDLPSHLRACLLYLSLYPEDCAIDTEYLIWKWVGEGFVMKEPGKSLYEVGWDYVNDLINKSLIQPGKRYGISINSFCRVHDVVLDLICYLANEDNFLTTLGGHQRTSLPNTIRRLSLQMCTEDDAKQLLSASLSHVRSLTVFPEAFTFLPALSRFPILRSLDLSCCRQVDNQHCKDICNLLHLRYLVLCGTSITKIPEQIGNLQFLLVLDISSNDIEELPPSFVQLQQLVCLRICHDTRLPVGFGNLKSLQELHPREILIRSPTMLHEFGMLTELRYLVIHMNEWDHRYLEPLHFFFSNLVSIEFLLLSGIYGDIGFGCDNLLPGPQNLHTLDISFLNCLHPVSKWMSSLLSLSTVRITLLTLGEEDLDVLGRMPSLKQLTLVVEKSTEGRDKKLVIGDGCPFPCLTKLDIWKTLETVFAQGAMKKLQTLDLRFDVWQTMDRFGKFDFGLENLPSLQDISVRMHGRYAQSEEVEAAEVAIRNSVHMNPNKPRLELETLKSQ